MWSGWCLDRSGSGFPWGWRQRRFPCVDSESRRGEPRPTARCYSGKTSIFPVNATKALCTRTSAARAINRNIQYGTPKANRISILGMKNQGNNANIGSTTTLNAAQENDITESLVTIFNLQFGHRILRISILTKCQKFRTHEPQFGQLLLKNLISLRPPNTNLMLYRKTLCYSID